MKLNSEKNCVYSLSSAQKSIYFAQKTDEKNPRFNCGFYFYINREVDDKILLEAIFQLSEEAELQRGSIFFSEGDIFQKISYSASQVVEKVAFLSTEEAEFWMNSEMTSCFSLENGPLFKLYCIDIENDFSILFVKYHHILLDGFGQNLLLKRLEEIYNALNKGERGPLCDWTDNQTYFDEIDKRHSLARHQASLNNILSHYSSIEDVVTLGRANSSFAQSILQSRVSLPDTLLAQIKHSAQYYDVPEAIFLTALVSSYIHLITGEDRIVLGLPVSARTRGALISKPSMQSNEWPLCFDFSGDKELSPVKAFAKLIERTKSEISLALSHQEIRNETLHHALNRNGLDEKLTKTLVNILPFGSQLSLGEQSITVHQLATGPVADLNVNIFLKSDSLDLLWDANPDNYTQKLLDQHAERFTHYVKASIAEVPFSVSYNDLFLETDRLALKQLKGDIKDWDLTQPLFKQIDEQARLAPRRLAVECAQHKLTYAQLKRQTDALAETLVKQGGATQSAVGIYGKRSALMTVALLAVQKAGCAYVPLDPDLPEARLAQQIQQADIQQILYWGEEPDVNVPCLKVTLIDESEIVSSVVLPNVNGDMPAYIIFTSGSTGQPKGVVVSHAAIANRIYWMQDQYTLDEYDRVLQKTPFTFDVSLWEFFWPLVVGARQIIADPEAHKDPRKICEAIDNYGITTLHFVPPMLDLFLHDAQHALPSLKRIFCSGEALKPKTVQETLKRFSNVELHNLYGPTEAAVDVSYWPCSLQDTQSASIPIGLPVANTALWVLNAAQRPAVLGIPGELYIAGPQVAQGYVNQPDLTADRFVRIDGIDGILYRTGDLVVVTEDKGLEFLGRLDHQVKIRGLRVELAEIEAQLMMNSSVRQALVTVENAEAVNPQLVAYLVMKQRDELENIQRALAKTLPDYMLPTQWIVLEQFPLTANGKINRRALPKSSKPDTIVSQAIGEAEIRLQTVWQEVLGLGEIDVETPFFSLGGDSMMAIRVRSSLEQQGWTFNLAELFRNPTVRELAQKLTSYTESLVIQRVPFQDIRREDIGLLPEKLEDAFPMSAMQESMVYQAEVDQNSSVYRVVTSLTIERVLEKTLLESALSDIIQRHPLLRSSFDLSTYSQPLVLVHSNVCLPLTYETPLVHLSSEEQQAFIQNWVEEAKFQTFDLSQAPALRFYVHVLGDMRFQLSVVEHHVALDGWSDLLMLNEMVENYRQRLERNSVVLPSLRSHYADFVHTESTLQESKQARDYWQKVAANVDAIPLSQKEIQQETSHHSYQASISPELNRALMNLADHQQCSIKSLLVAAHLTALGLITGSEHVAAGMVFNGRLDQPDADKVIGVFLNTHPLSVSLEQRNYLDLASDVTEFEYHSYPYGRYPYSAMQRESSNDLMLDNYVNYMDFHQQWGDGSIVSQAFGVANTNFPLAVNFLVNPVNQALSLWFDCDLGKLDAALCERLPEYYLAVLNQMVRDPYVSVLSTDIVTPQEHQLMVRWSQTDRAYNKDLLVHQQFELVAAQTPHRTALSWLDQTLTYGELNIEANRIAHMLIDAGVNAGELVGICVPRCPQLLASMLAIHKIGAAFLPLDPKYPVDRLNYIVEDSGVRAVLTHAISPSLNIGICLAVDNAEVVEAFRGTNLARFIAPESMAYSIYTSGSTGLPKGTMITHQNLLNFLTGMDDAIGCEESDTLLALTSSSFDISILELYWPLTKGADIVLGSENQIYNLSDNGHEFPSNSLDFSLFFFGAASGVKNRNEAYQLVLDAARYADQHDFKAIWTPERHFHEFGGLYPNPSVLSAALATITQQIELRSGSVVAPLHDPIRIAEEWSLVDNLSNGRVGLALASGWNSNDFALAPESYQGRKTIMLEKLQQLRTLWEGENILRLNGEGSLVEIALYPHPVQKQLPLWLTSSGAVSTFELAGTYGLNILTHLLGQSIQELAEKLRAYHSAWEAAGHPEKGHVSLMVHTFLLPNEKEAKTIAKGPFREYLRTSTGLLRQLTSSMGIDFPEDMLSEDMDSILDLAVERYFEQSGLFGTPESVMPLVQQLQSVGVDEIASLIDFGISNADIMRGLSCINQLRLKHLQEHKQAQYSCERLIKEHQVTLMQSTPSFMSAAMSDTGLLQHLSSLKKLLVGGEPFPAGLASAMTQHLSASIFNMYGPTETTIWSSVHQVTADSIVNNRIPIGRPIANTYMKVLNSAGKSVPVGVSGELWIGGEGVCSGYLDKPELTAERFQTFPDGRRYYRTGDRVCWQHNGELLFLGRVDRQVKLRGHRIELDEIEGVLSRNKAIRSAAVVLQSLSDELIAYVEADVQVQNKQDGQQLVKQWGELWDNAYRDRHNQNSADAKVTDFAGWLSSYTGENIPVNEMEEWLEHTLRKVERYHPKAIIDVGVGMGLYLRRLIHNCQNYVGIDLSEEALNACRAYMETLKEDQSLSLIQGEALVLNTLPEGTSDFVLINSVAQYFPGEAYLTQVINAACKASSKQGTIFLGDIRSFTELPLFHTQVQFEKASPLTTVSEINSLIQRHLKLENELCLAPGYFTHLKEQLKELSTVEFELKRGHASNELNDFRYDVILTVNGSHDNRAIEEQAFDDNVLSSEALAHIGQAVGGVKSNHMIIRDIPNHRLDRIRLIQKLLNELPPTATKWDLDKKLWELEESETLSPETLISHFETQGYRARLLFQPEKGLSFFDLELTPVRDLSNTSFEQTLQTGNGVTENTL